VQRILILIVVLGCTSVNSDEGLKRVASRFLVGRVVKILGGDTYDLNYFGSVQRVRIYEEMLLNESLTVTSLSRKVSPTMVYIKAA
jgi:hypothetical protein